MHGRFGPAHVDIIVAGRWRRALTAARVFATMAAMGSLLRRLPLMALVLLASASLAAAGGGRTIATAPTIPLGEEQLNSLSGIDFWRIPLQEGDRVTLRYGNQSNGNWVEICLLTPDVTDATVGNQRCYDAERSFGDGSVTLDARPAGLWTLAVLPYPGCESGGIVDLRCKSSVSYHLTAYVKHKTRMKLTAPSVVRRGSRFTVRGSLSGMRNQVIVQQSWNGGGWRTAAVVRPTSNGAFSVRFRPNRTGALRVRAMFPEAPLYLGSSAIASVRVV
jgi:hypothetical protein